jgi:RNA polymerase sigma-70 factor (ECF subfamily)
MTDEHELLAKSFEANRAHLRSVAYRMLGSAGEVDDAVQEAWLRLSRTDAGSISNLGGWLTTVVARVCLDMLRSRKSRREEPLVPGVPEPMSGDADGMDAEQEMLLADSVGVAMLVVLETLEPAERLAFVLHDMFDVPFDEIAPVVGRSTAAARQLASRARRRVQGKAPPPAADQTRHRKIVDAFLAAARGSDMQALLALLDPDVVFRADAAAVRLGGRRLHGRAEVLGSKAVAEISHGGARAARTALVDGELGFVVAPGGRLLLVVRFTIAEGRIVSIDAVAEPDDLQRLEVVPLDN